MVKRGPHLRPQASEGEAQLVGKVRFAGPLSFWHPWRCRSFGPDCLEAWRTSAHVGRLESEETAMPGHFCHMEAPHKKLRLPEWYVSSLMMDRALDAVVRRVKNFDRDHDIPYLAGYSRDGKTIYIDRHMPPSFRYRGRDIDTDRFLILHEEVEKT